MSKLTDCTYGVFCANPDAIAHRVMNGEEVIITHTGKPWALLRSIDVVKLPADGNYRFVGLEGFKRGRDTNIIRDYFDQGKLVVIKDYPKGLKAYPLSSHPNKNIILMRPVQKMSP
jgi:hypothetical protein